MIGRATPGSAESVARKPGSDREAARSLSSAAMAALDAGNLEAAVEDKLKQLAQAGPEHDAIANLTKEIIERVVWEIVPELAESIIRRELDRLVKERNS